MLKILKRLSLINKQHNIGASQMDFEAVHTIQYGPRKDDDPLPVEWTGLCQSGEI